MSIRTVFADAIFSGIKRHEFRRVRVAFKPGDIVFVYEPVPVACLTGQFTVAGVKYGEADDLISLESTIGTQAVARCYLKGARNASAIEITQARRWEAAVSLACALPGVRAPQSYAFLGGGEPYGIFRGCQ